MRAPRIGGIGSVFLLCLTCGPVGAAVLRVPEDYPKVREALKASAQGDEIVLAPGRHSEMLTLPGWDVVLRSENPLDPATVEATLLDTSGLETVLTFTGTESPAFRVEGLTITGGNTWLQSSKPLAIEGNHSRPTIQFCRFVSSVRTKGNDGGLVRRCDGRFEQNWFKDNDGGLLECDGEIVANWFQGNTWAIQYSEALIQENLFQENDIEGAVSRCTGRFINNTFRGNYSKTGGSAMSSCKGTIWGNVFVDNRGGALYGCSGTLLFNTFYRNKTAGQGAAAVNCKGTIANCIFWGNEQGGTYEALDPETRDLYSCDPPTSSCIRGLRFSGSGNFEADPLFFDPAEGNVSLRPESPCIDAAGAVYMEFETDILGNGRDRDALENNLNGSDADMGALEYAGPPVFWDAPMAPVLLFPADGATTVSRQPVLQTAAFVDPQPDVQFLASQWQLSDFPDFSSLRVDRTLTGGDRLHLYVEAQDWKDSGRLYWRVRHQNSGRVWSDWPKPFVFTIRAENVTYVPGDYPTVQEAIDHAEAGWEIVVAPGRYVENLVITGKDLRLRSQNPFDPETVKSTILDGDRKGPVIRLDESVTSATCISGFTITRGLITALVDWGYTAHGGGGGIACFHSRATIEYNRIVRNSTWAGVPFPPPLFWPKPATGGGIGDAEGWIRNNLIMNNYCEGHGGGLCAVGGAIVENNTIVRNGGSIYHFVTEGGGLYAYSRVTIRNNILWGNSAGEWVDSETHDLADQISASSYSYNCIQDWEGVGGGEGNTGADPRFFNAENADFRLLPDSPCIDAGASQLSPFPDARGLDRPIDGTAEPRGDGSDVDMGMFEYSSDDFYLGVVSHILGRPLSEGYPTDVNGDGQINAADVTRSRMLLPSRPPTAPSSR